MLNTDQGDVILRTVRPLFGNNEKTDSFRTLLRIWSPGKQQMNNVIRHIVVSISDKLLGAFYQIMSFFLFGSACNDISHCAPCMRFSQTHCTGPFPTEHILAKFIFLYIRTKGVDQVCRTSCKRCSNGKSLVGSKLGFFADNSD